MVSPQHRAFRITSRVHKGTGLIASYSDDLPGLMVVARTEEEISRNLPSAVRELLEAQGLQIIKLYTVPSGEPSEFGPPGFIVHTDALKAA